MNKKSFLNLILALGFIMTLSACSSGVPDEVTDGDEMADVSDEAAPEANTDEFADASLSEDGFSDDDLGDAPAADKSADPDLTALPNVPADPMDMPAESNYSAPSSPTMTGETASYKVRAGDTLMKIAFEMYGNIHDWKKVYQNNKNLIADPNSLPRGAVLTLEQPAGPVAIDKNGKPYLIKTGDTLGSISNEVYGSTKKWRKIWDNNRQLIKDPNKIYAGFYLYYVPEEGGAQPLVEETPPSNQQRAPGAAR